MHSLKTLGTALLVVCTIAAAPAAAQTPRAQLLVDTTWLAAHATDANLVMLHMGDPVEYAKKHIPGSRLVTRAQIAAPTAPGSLNLELPAPDELKTKLEALGISDGFRIIVIFGSGWVSPATRVVLTMQAAGLGDRTSLLDGGLEAWEKAGKPLTTDVPATKTGALSPLKMASPIVDADFVTAHLTDAKTVIIDARDKELYTGEKTGGSASVPHKTGHIAGAKSLPYTTVVRDDNTLKSEAELQALFDAAGVKPGDTVVAYCHIGQQATAVVFAARTLGINVKLYDGSFEDWSKRDGKTIK
ncbi:MAG: sulfurtransferase [Acidobacteria bacterium]|nr:sulfurtransferase [Acidobacteriota bacterium]